MKNDKCCQLGRMVAQARMFIIRSYLTYWHQSVVVLFIGVDGVVVAVAADGDLLVVVDVAGVDPGVVGVDGTEVRPLSLPPETVLARGRHEVSEGRVVLSLHQAGPAPPAQGPGEGEVFTIRGVTRALAVRT